jgi:hypothetical protein
VTAALLVISIALALTACSRVSSPTAPLAVVTSGPELVHLEAESGSGTRDIRKRLRASGGVTVHLAPGERLSWVFDARGLQTPYELAVTYANGREGANETLHVSLDGVRIRTFVDRDSGDAVEGWETFVTDPAGSASLEPGSHTIAIESEGGDGCVEIDFIRVVPIDSLVPQTGSR